ncbi:MAG: FecR family protein [Myxococcota bacterium]|nr:FecR family protein [Myxococcota bacterium]
MTRNNFSSALAGIRRRERAPSGRLSAQLSLRAQLGAQLGASLLILILAGPSFAADPIGFVAAVEGKVDRLRANESTWTAAVLDEDVHAGDTLRTGLNSVAKIVLLDDTVLGLGEDTELLINNLVLGPDALVKPSVLRQVRGQIRTRVGEAFGGVTRIEVHTPTAIMGVKGTEGTTRVNLGGGDAKSRAAVPAREEGQPLSAFDIAFADARKEQGPGGLFLFGGKSYSTDTAADSNDSPNYDEPSTLVRNWEGGITAGMLSGDKLPVPPGMCRLVYIDRIGKALSCPSDFVPVDVPVTVGGDLAQVQADLLIAALPPVSAGVESGGIGSVVGEALLIEPTDPVLEDRTDSDAFLGIGVNPLANLDFGAGEVGPDPGGNPLGGLGFGGGEVQPDP